MDGFYVGIGAKAGVSVLAQVKVEVGANGLWLQPDGRFVKGGSVSMFSDFGSSSVQTGGDRQARTGTYQINGYTLTLNFDDGETQSKAFFLLDEVPVIEGDLYEKLN